jgi:hypothetical protein
MRETAPGAPEAFDGNRKAQPNCSNAASRSSTISAAMMSGGGSESVSVRFLDPEEVEAELIAFEQVLVAEAAPASLRVCLAPGLRALMDAARFVALNELVEIRALDGLLLQRVCWLVRRS